MAINVTNNVSAYNMDIPLRSASRSDSDKSPADNKRIAAKDTVEISKDAYKLQNEEKFTATSGRDTLGISKGDKDGEYVIHFVDSSDVNRTVERGYLTVNGKTIMLSDEDKKTLLSVGKEAEKKRMQAYESYVMQHETAVAAQQAEAWKKALDGSDNGLLKILEAAENSDKKERTKEDMLEGVRWSDFKWEKFETQMRIMPDEKGGSRI